MNPVSFYIAQGWRVTSPYGPRVHPITGAQSHHNGIDFGDKPSGHPVQTPFPGVVVAAQFYPSRGNTVVVKIAPNVHQLCQHLLSFKCKPGDRVAAGDVIGLNGSSGDSTGAHLHYELRTVGNPWGDVWGDPAKFELEVFELKTAIVINTFADFPFAEGLAEKYQAPIFTRKALAQLNAETVIVAGGDAEPFKKQGVKVIDLGGKNRYETGLNIAKHLGAI